MITPLTISHVSTFIMQNKKTLKPRQSEKCMHPFDMECAQNVRKYASFMVCDPTKHHICDELVRVGAK